MPQRQNKKKFRDVRKLVANDRIIVVRPLTLQVLELLEDRQSALVRIVRDPFEDVGDGQYVVRFASQQARCAYLGNPSEVQRLRHQLSELTEALRNQGEETLVKPSPWLRLSSHDVLAKDRRRQLTQ